MVVKAVEMVRKIRDKHYDETKALSVENQIQAVKQKSGRLQKTLEALRRRPVSSVRGASIPEGRSRIRG